MQRIAINRDPDTLIAAGEVVELRFRDGGQALSLRSAKLLHLLVDNAGAKACEDVEHTALIADLNFSHLESTALLDCIHDLQQTLVEFTYRSDDGEMRVMSAPILAYVDRPRALNTAQGTIAYNLSKVLREVLRNSNHWAALSRDAVLAFESRYALRLYEMIALRANLKHKASETFDMNDLRRRLGVPDGKLLGWSPFRQFALDKAIAEVNQLSGLDVSYEAIKRGRRVDRVALTWTQRDGSGRAGVARELAHSRVGRRARRDGTVETVEFAPAPPRIERATFPATGGLKHGDKIARWRDLAEKHVKRLSGGHLPDLQTLADQFRAFCEGRNIPLDAANIEKTFVGFCQKYNPPS